MAKRASGEQKSGRPETPKAPKLTLLDLGRISFQLSAEGQPLSVESASDSEFDAFIRAYVDVGWSLEERRDALNFAIESGKLEIPGLEPEIESENQEEIKEISNAL